MRNKLKVKTKVLAGDSNNRLGVNHNKVKVKTKVVAGDSNRLGVNHNSSVVAQR